MTILGNVLPFAIFRKKQIEMEKRKQIRPKKRERDFPSPDREETLIKRSIAFPDYVWNAVAAEAKREKRNVTAQIEYILCKWLHLEGDDVAVKDESEAAASRRVYNVEWVSSPDKKIV